MGSCLSSTANSTSSPGIINRPPTTVCTDEIALSTGRDLNDTVETLRVFTFKELASATGNFKGGNEIGEGSFGIIYKGWLHKDTLSPANNGRGMAVAVKYRKPHSFSGSEEWQKEVGVLGRITHPNLIALLGYCREDDKLLLVYEFMENGSLQNRLLERRGAEAKALLSWEQRLHIAAGAARALAFLHSPENNIIHRDFHPAHILLDSNFNPKISGLGLAKDGPTEADSHLSTRIMGTYGFAAPEYIATGHLTAKADVYGFGVVLLILLSGKGAIDANRSGRLHLVELAKSHLSNRKKLAKMMDPALEGKYPVKATLGVAKLAERCVNDDHRSRPSMDEVVEIIQRVQSSNYQSEQVMNGDYVTN
ncbi:probable serine/threonine-protein kinase PIX13 [Zingiber officinale]|uniref:Protein kinase domain-containing protein n=1 Tax=Zingiber officinale TaxID=94328 RepID=A0A8J5LSV9_ZINOF|nr:probable serine/threonine-protein kinase PIX13 [Zingiber officinale]KAG6533399.1 hypothetical protein ZIOFF_007267 [Zingiber officinale]